MFNSWKHQHYFESVLSKSKNCGSLNVVCRKQDVLNLRFLDNIHVEPYKLLKTMFTSKSALLCTVEIITSQCHAVSLFELRQIVIAS